MKEINTINDCLKMRMLRKVKPDLKKSEKSIELAKKELREAKSLLNKEEQILTKYAIVSSYMAMFHSARAILFKDGFKEKNHYSLFIYLKEKYNQIPPHFLNLLNIHRAERHEALYGLEYEPDKEDAKIALEDATTFVKEMEKLLK